MIRIAAANSSCLGLVRLLHNIGGDAQNLACPLGNIAFDGAKVFKCDLCSGKPNCALHCPTGAIEYKEAIPSAMLKRKALADKFKDVFGEEE